MMKKNILILLGILTLSIFNSCNEDYLDIQQQGVLTTDKYAEADDESVQSFIASVYYQVMGGGYGNYGYINTIRDLSEIGGEAKSGDPSWDFTETSESIKVREMWSYHYRVIYACNMIIENLPDNNVASETVINRVIAEARAVRSIMMMRLVQLWGNPPLADHIMLGDESNTPAATSWEFIESELLAVADELPSKTDMNAQALIGGRLTKEAVYAFLGKAYLWQGKYSEAASTLHDKVIATGLYGLVDNFNDLNSSSKDFCEEYIWEFNRNSDPSYATSQNGAFLAVFLNWLPTIAYPENHYQNNGWAYAAYPTESFGTFMENHDVSTGRYRGTICNYDELFDESKFSYPDSDRGLLNSQTQPNLVGYFRVKSVPLQADIIEGSIWYSDFIVTNTVYMRYAEVLLNYAEAVAMGGTPGATSGLEALNMVRRRAGLSDALSLNMDDDAYGIKAERRAELFFEGCRYIDIVRWGDAAAILAGYGKEDPTFYGYKDGSTSGAQSKENWEIVYTPTTSNGYVSPKNDLLPIPLIEINNNPNLTQNTGW